MRGAHEGVVQTLSYTWVGRQRVILGEAWPTEHLTSVLTAGALQLGRVLADIKVICISFSSTFTKQPTCLKSFVLGECRSCSGKSLIWSSIFDKFGILSLHRLFFTFTAIHVSDMWLVGEGSEIQNYISCAWVCSFSFHADCLRIIVVL